MSGQGRAEFWPEGFEPHDPRARAAHPWYAAAEGLDLDALPEGELRRLLAEAIGHVRQLLDSSDEADRAEDRDLPGTHLTMDGEAVIRGEDVLTVLAALADGAWWQAQHGDPGNAARYRALARSLGDDR